MDRLPSALLIRAESGFLSLKTIYRLSDRTEDCYEDTDFICDGKISVLSSILKYSAMCKGKTKLGYTSNLMEKFYTLIVDEEVGKHLTKSWIDYKVNVIVAVGIQEVSSDDKKIVVVYIKEPRNYFATCNTQPVAGAENITTLSHDTRQGSDEVTSALLGAKTNKNVLKVTRINVDNESIISSLSETLDELRKFREKDKGKDILDAAIELNVT
ncbi:putative protein P24 [Pistachio ampelovirus A]|uniref:Uncharacterized protein n=1 Tax=Pistachio ampelovirus A TaxID=2093224 RepID=A0A499Q1Z0_9CLOS|nr:putative protein P24 [Pistachio ampelovirus A]AVN99314.1 putative protein P24 [Pistachio ampelovirus A]